MFLFTQKQINFNKLVDWEIWISNVYHHVTTLDVWHLINLSIAEKFACLEKPTQPNVTEIFL